MQLVSAFLLFRLLIKIDLYPPLLPCGNIPTFLAIGDGHNDPSLQRTCLGILRTVEALVFALSIFRQLRKLSL